MADKPSLDLDGMDVTQLTALIAAAEGKRLTKIEEAKEAFRAETVKKAAELGLTIDDLFPSSEAKISPGRKRRTDAGTSAPIKYRGPQGQEWSGRGRRPAWLNDAEAEGKSREDYRV